jgi:DNA-directed RNA polymerase subunit RPC12/RpoP
METSNIALIHIPAPCKLAGLIGITFGIYDKEEIEWMKKALRAEVMVIPGDICIADYIGMCKSLSSKWSALDVASYGLNRYISKGGVGIPKTIVVGENNAAQFSLFWNLRMQVGAGSSREILLFPTSEIENQDSKKALVEWIAASPERCNYTEVISISTEVEYLRSLADWLEPRVKGFGVDFIDIYYGNVQIPVVVGYDTEISASVDLDERIVTFAPPLPRFYELLPANRRWIVDLLKDKRTLRVPLEIYPVPSVSAKEVLNAPFPPSLKLGLDRVRIGTDGLSFACAKEDGDLRYFMPTEAEFLQEAYHSFGMDMVRDEKRVCYEAVLQVFKDLEEAGRAFSGFSLSILLALRGGKDLTLGELKGKAKLGKMSSSEPPGLDRLDQWLVGSPVRQRITRNRFATYWEKEYPSEDQALEVLDYLINLGVVNQFVRLPKCNSCGHEYTVDKVDLQKPIVCPGCSSRISFSCRLELAYKLNALFSMALSEGILPVILTGRFLRRLTDRSFMWIPGVKCKHNGQQYDIDIACFCDGNLILAECKSMLGVKEESDEQKEVLEQFSHLINLGKICGARTVFFGSMTNSHPDYLVRFSEENTSSTMTIGLLDREDLELGRRFKKVQHAESRVPMRLWDFLPKEVCPQPKREYKPGARRLGF